MKWIKYDHYYRVYQVHKVYGVYGMTRVMNSMTYAIICPCYHKGQNEVVAYKPSKGFVKLLLLNRLHGLFKKCLKTAQKLVTFPLGAK